MSRKRGLAALVVVLVLAAGVIAIGGGPQGTENDRDRIDVAAARTERALKDRPNPTRPPQEPSANQGRRDNQPPNTTTPNPPPTTQTTAPPNTVPPTAPATTAPPTTAPPTTAPPTSTTRPSPTPSQPGQSFLNVGSFEVWLRGTDGNGPDIFWWNAPYKRQLSYGLNTGWTDGDRAGYRCLYSFLYLDDEIVGRVTFMRVEGASTYASIKDENMKEGVRYYDGTLAPDGISIELGDCPAPDLAYTPYTGPDQRPTVVYSTTSGQTLEIRNYKPTVVGEGITFQQTEQTPGRVTVVAYQFGNPVIVVYYESMSPNVVMSSDL